MTPTRTGATGEHAPRALPCSMLFTPLFLLQAISSRRRQRPALLSPVQPDQAGQRLRPAGQVRQGMVAGPARGPRCRGAPPLDAGRGLAAGWLPSSARGRTRQLEAALWQQEWRRWRTRRRWPWRRSQRVQRKRTRWRKGRTGRPWKTAHVNEHSSRQSRFCMWWNPATLLCAAVATYMLVCT